jgi:S1-C subfamily serine protease
MTLNMIDQLSDALADRLAVAAPVTVSVQGAGRPRSGILWRPDVVVTSEQMLGPIREDGGTDLTVVQGGTEIAATLAGRDTGTNVAVLRLMSPLGGALPAAAAPPRAGSLALVVGADSSGKPIGRLAMVHAVGGAWHSMAGGRVDAMIRLDTRLGTDEGGPVLGAAGGLLGMSTSGPRRRTLVIPAETIARVVDPLLTEGRIARGWLGVGLQPVMVPDSLRAAAERDAGMMVVSLAPGAPGEVAGVLPGDILLDMDGMPAPRPRALAAALGPERIGQTVTLRVLRAGVVVSLSAVIAARPPK